MCNKKTFKINILIFPIMLILVSIIVFVFPVIVHAAEETPTYQYFMNYTTLDENSNTYAVVQETLVTDSELFLVDIPSDSNGATFAYLVTRGFVESEKTIYHNITRTKQVQFADGTTANPTNNIRDMETYNFNLSTVNITKPYGTVDFTTSIPYFKSYESLVKYITLGDDSGQANKHIDMSKATYNSKIPVPKLVFNGEGGYKFSIDNAVEGYYIQMKGRWYTVDDLTLYKENLQWKYKYDTLIKGTLTEWVEPNDKILATAQHDLCDMNRNGYGGEAFNSLLTKYPIDNRKYSGGTNALGNKLSGYTDALSTLKDFHLKNPLSAFNSPEIYIRFIVVNKDSVEYGKWCHWYSNLANSSGSSGSNLDDSDNVSGESQSLNGLTDDDLTNNEKQENPRNDSDIYTYVNSDYIKQNIEISSEIANKTGAFFDLLSSMFNAMGQFPQMFKDVFSFLPPWFINFIVIAMGAIIIARFIGR